MSTGTFPHAPPILLVGLDGATFDLIKPWAAQGKLPALARILAEGAHAPLRSTMPPVTPLAWSSFITGTNPGQHGVYGFVSRRPSSYDWFATTAATRHGLSLWEWAGRCGRRVGVVNMPMTYPPETIPGGFQVSGLGVPDVDVPFAWPESLQRDLLARYRPEQLVEQPVSLYDVEGFLDYLLQTVDDSLDLTHYLLGRYPETDLLCTVFTATDRVQHFYWRQMLDPGVPEREHRAIELVYRRVDAALGDLLARYPDSTFVVMSDHGSGPYRHLIGMNHWLATKGWLHWQGAASAPGRLATQAWRLAYNRLGLALPGPIRRYLKRIAPDRLLSTVRQEMGHWTLPADWEKTRAYSAGYGGNIYLNLAGREPCGQVLPGREAERLLSRIEAELLALVDPGTGEPVVDHVLRGADLYHGVRMADAPDLVVAWHDGYYSMAGLEGPGTAVFQGHLRWPDSRAVHSAEHRLHGILMAWGHSIAAGTSMPEARIEDLAPTLLHLMGLPIPDSMEGRVALELLDPAHGGPRATEPLHVEWQQPALGAAYTTAEEQAVQARLRRLGYLDEAH